PKGVEFTYAMRFRFEATNNEAEYEALIASLRIIEQIGVKNLQANVDSWLVANQVNGSYVAKESGMVQYLEKVKTLISNFKEFSIKQVPRSENKKAYALSKIASTSFAHLSKQVLVEELKEKFINEKEVLTIVEEEEHTWMSPICEYLTKEILPEDKKKARAVRRKASSMHSGPKSMVTKAIRIGYYWPTMHADVRKWRIDIAGPFPEGPGKVKFLIVAIDYFTKWIEAKPIMTITSNQVKKFVWDNIICRFGLPGRLYRITESSFVTTHSKTGVRNYGKESKVDWMKEAKTGWENSHTSYGHTAHQVGSSLEGNDTLPFTHARGNPCRPRQDSNLRPCLGGIQRLECENHYDIERLLDVLRYSDFV
ncbi:reverse transcriptase domain-containing protein, partial [Tanacetum coccineum]